MTAAELTKTRKKLGLSQRRLSTMLRKDVSFICKVENGHRHLREELQEKIKKAFTKFRTAKRTRKAKR